MSYDEALKKATSIFITAQIETARLDSLVLLEAATNFGRASLLAHLDSELTPEQAERFGTFIQRRARHEPVAYILQRIEFYGRDFYVDNRVLVPRPESEAIIDLLLSLRPGRDCRLADIGTGSGVLAITAALEFPIATVIASDIDPECLAIARRNAESHSVQIDFLSGSLLEPFDVIMPDIILANLPYVPHGHPVNKAAGFEPKSALFAGPDGMDVFRGLLTSISCKQRMPSFVLTESLTTQHGSLAQIASSHGYHLETTLGLAQLFTSTRA